MVAKELTNKLQQSKEGLMEGLFLHLSLFGHHGEVWLDHWSKLNLELLFVHGHLFIVAETVALEEVLIHFDVSNALVVHKWLETNGTEVWKVNSALNLNLTVHPATRKFKLLGPLQVRSSLKCGKGNLRLTW